MSLIYSYISVNTCINLSYSVSHRIRKFGRSFNFKCEFNATVSVCLLLSISENYKLIIIFLGIIQDLKIFYG